MATIQKRRCRGHTYWSIVESRRVNGKPRPVILKYLGTAEAFLERLTEGIPKKVRSYSHGTVAVMLDIAEELQIVETINKHIPHKQLRDGFTVGGSLLLAAIGRVCYPTSKRNWFQGWARHTSLSYLLRMSINKLDSQHFWDQMDALPTEAIPLIIELPRWITTGILLIPGALQDSRHTVNSADRKMTTPLSCSLMSRLKEAHSGQYTKPLIKSCSGGLTRCPNYKSHIFGSWTFGIYLRTVPGQRILFVRYSV